MDFPRNIIICCDGTANSPVKDRTNVMRLWLILTRDPGQIVYYDPGVGTLGSPGLATGVGRRLSRIIDMATGKSVRQNVLEAYEFLMDTYKEGDRLYFFGFSRGAYTVRALAGLIDMFGLLPKGSRNLLPHLWAMYSNDEGDTPEIGKRMKLAYELRTLNRRVEIHMLGVWDTVSSWGLFFNFGSLPRTYRNLSVRHIRHAVAIDERRAAFRQNTFDHEKNHDVAEVWFPGVHCDVGGGYPENESGLAKIAMKWMLDEAEELGLRVDPAKRAKVLGGTPSKESPQMAVPYPCAMMHESLKGFWRVMEWLPKRVWLGESVGKRWRCNFGKRRVPLPGGLAVHVAVGERQRSLGYRPANIVA